MKGIFSVLVENRAGVLCKVAGLFSRRCYNIDSLAVGETEDKEVSVMTIVSSGDERTMEQIEKQLNKKLDIIKVKTFNESNSVCRELMLIKVKYQQNNRSDIIEICNVLNASVLDMSAGSLLIQICDTPEKIELLIKMLSPFGIVELARTGTLALQKCMDNEKTK
ncbi:MAG: acetolactate synthase small subunit [Lachnospiraceae bacterium]|nr:acetolactate synthase small subunit [Lachnospiraceae bacterium]